MTRPRVFDMPRADRVLEGEGALAALPEEIGRRGARRVVVLSGSSVAALDAVTAFTGALGDRLAGHWTGIAAHNPSGAVADAAAAAQDAGADLVVAIGGGSPVDAAKLVAFALAAGVTGRDQLEQAATADGAGVSGIDPVPVVAVPTTLSAAEWNGLAGVTVDGVKRRVFHPRLAPGLVVLDPDLAAHTPRELWTTTGVRAVDHAVEAVYAADAHPFGTALALEALTMLAEHLPRTTTAPDPADTLACQRAAELSVLAMPNVSLGLSHAIGHQLGAVGVPHGVTSCVVLPHVVRLFAASAPAAMERIAAALGRGTGRSGPAPELLEGLLDDLGVPRTLSSQGLGEDDLDAVAAATTTEQRAFEVAPRPVDESDVRALLQAAL